MYEAEAIVDIGGLHTPEYQAAAERFHAEMIARTERTHAQLVADGRGSSAAAPAVAFLLSSISVPMQCALLTGAHTRRAVDAAAAQSRIEPGVTGEERDVGGIPAFPSGAKSAPASTGGAGSAAPVGGAASVVASAASSVTTALPLLSATAAPVALGASASALSAAGAAGVGAVGGIPAFPSGTTKPASTGGAGSAAPVGGPAISVPAAAPVAGATGPRPAVRGAGVFGAAPPAPAPAPAHAASFGGAKVSQAAAASVASSSAAAAAAPAAAATTGARRGAVAAAAGGGGDVSVTPCADEAAAEAVLVSEIIAHAPPDFVKLIVWNFDLTLVHIHSTNENINASDVAFRDVPRDFVDLPFFKALIGYLRRQRVHVAVASFGRYETIQAYMTAALGDGVFNRRSISTPTVVGDKDGSSVKDGRHRQLDALCKHYGVSRSGVLFFDDEQQNIRETQSARYRAFHTPDGFSRKVWFQTMHALGALAID